MTHRETDSGKERSRTLYYAETPFHVFAELCFLHTQDGGRANGRYTDFVLGNRFDGAKDLADRIRRADLFENVYLVPLAHQDIARFGTKFYTDYFFRKKKTKKWFYDQYPMFKGIHYDELIISAPLRAQTYINWFCAKDPKTVLVEDGLGTYNGEMFDNISFLDDIIVLDSKDPLKTKIKHMAKKGLALIAGQTLYHPETLYLLGGVEQARARYKNIELQQNMPPNSENSELFEEVFPIKSNNLYRDHRFVFLATADLDDETKKNEEQFFNVISGSLCEKILLRSHPREERTFETIQEYDVDTSGDLWEMLCAKHYVNDNTVLFSLCSTAQLNPRLVFGAEPYVVFLYRLLPNGSCIDKESAERTFEQVLDLYTNKSKVMAPRSIEELVAAVQKLVDSRLR